MLHEGSDRIVVVDDTPTLAEALAEYLRLSGYGDISVYSDPRKALSEILANPRPAMVITDFKMPVMTGLELLKEIDRQFPEIIGIIVTGSPTEALCEPHRFQVIEKGNSMFADLTNHIQAVMRQ